jgi:SpoIVB peptidase S55
MTGGNGMRTAAVVVLAAAICLGGGAAGIAQTAQPPAIMPLAELRPGMTGYGLTVIHGTTIQRFDIQILGVLRGDSTDLILFRATGPVIQQAGGAASGMSGSPIYVGDRIAGALSYGYHFAGLDADLSLATPIEEMLKALSPETGKAGVRPPWLYSAARTLFTPVGPIDRVVVMASEADAAAFNAAPLPGMAAVSPTAVPMFATGMTPAAMAVLSKGLHRFNIVPSEASMGYRRFAAPPLGPGSSFGVTLVQGDVEVGAIGTVTYRRGNLIIGFGHPFLNAGPSSMMLTTAWIDTVVRSLDFPFKEGSIGDMVGSITQDRGVGVGGTVGTYPHTFGIRVGIEDADGGGIRVFGAQVVPRPDLAESLVPTTVLSLVQRAMDRIAGGSAVVRISLRARGFSHEIVREDMAYDIGDIATASVLDIPGATQLLFGNFFKAVDPIDMTIEIESTARPNTALLVHAHPGARDVHPGETLPVEITIQPFGLQEHLTRTVNVTVPREFPEGPAFLLVGTAGSLNNNSAPPDQVFQQMVTLEGTPSGTASLDELVDQFEHYGKNTEVLVQLVPEAVLTAVGSNANPGFESPAEAVIPSQWVVLGKFQIPMTVK